MEYKNDSVNSTIVPTPTKLSDYDQFVIYFRGYVTIFGICLGIIGNICSLIIFPRCVNKNAASVMYLTCLAITDLGCLIFYGLTEWFRAGARDMTGNWNWEPLAESAVLCKIFRYLGFTSFFFSSWIIIFYSGERVLAVWKPLKAKQLITPRRRKGALIFLFSFGFVIDVHYLVSYNIVKKPGSNTTTCFPDHNFFYPTRYMSIMQLFLKSLIPCLVLMAMNIAIIIGLRKSGYAKKGSSTSTSRREMMERKCTISLLIITTIFILLEAPYGMAWIIFNSYKYFVAGSKANILYWFKFGKLFTLISMFNNSLNVLVYAVSLDFYREKLKEIFCCCCYERKAEFQSWRLRQGTGSSWSSISSRFTSHRKVSKQETGASHRKLSKQDIGSPHRKLSRHDTDRV